MDITVTLLDGTSHVLRVNPQDTVGSLKTRIQVQLGVPVQKQKLVHNNGQRTTLSEDSRPVISYGLRSGSQLTLLITQPPTIQVTLINLEGEKHTYDIKPDETVRNFKNRVHCREGVPVSQQRLVYKDKQLMDHQLLSSYGLGAGCIIYLTSLLRAG